MGSQRKMGVTPKVKDLLLLFTLLPISCFHHPLLPLGQRVEERSLPAQSEALTDRPKVRPKQRIEQ